MPLDAACCCWAFIGLFVGIWKLAVVGGAVALFVWRQGLWRHPLWRFVRPWTTRARDVRPQARPEQHSSVEPVRPVASPARRGFWAKVASDRWYLLLAVTMALTLLAWVVARMTIHASTG